MNTDEYLTYKCAYIEKKNGDINGNYKDLVNRYTQEELLSATEYYRRNLEISVLITAVWYALNIIDATVDAHLFTYDINEDISFRVEPGIFTPDSQQGFGTGVKLSLRF